MCADSSEGPLFVFILFLIIHKHISDWETEIIVLGKLSLPSQPGIRHVHKLRRM